MFACTVTYSLFIYRFYFLQTSPAHLCANSSQPMSSLVFIYFLWNMWEWIGGGWGWAVLRGRGRRVVKKEQVGICKEGRYNNKENDFCITQNHVLLIFFSAAQWYNPCMHGQSTKEYSKWHYTSKTKHISQPILAFYLHIAKWAIF